MLTLPLEIKSDDKILIIAPHPDDESIGTGGLIAKFNSQIDVIVMTDGRYGEEKYNPIELKAIRKREFISAMEIAGVDCYKFFDVEDGTLISNKDKFEEIDIDKYAHVFLPNPDDNHSDHTACYEYVIDIIRSSKNKSLMVYQYEVHNPLSSVDSHLDITDEMDKKIRMVVSHKSQMDKHNYGKQIEALAKYRGLQNEHPNSYFEVYHKVDIYSENKRDVGIEIEAAKYKGFTKILSKWLHFETKEANIGLFLTSCGFSNVAVYGYGVLGKSLCDSLRNSNCRVEYIIDKNVVANENVPTFHSLENIPKVDAIIVTVVNGYQEIIDEIKSTCEIEGVFLGEILENMKDE